MNRNYLPPSLMHNNNSNNNNNRNISTGAVHQPLPPPPPPTQCDDSTEEMTVTTEEEVEDGTGGRVGPSGHIGIGQQSQQQPQHQIHQLYGGYQQHQGINALPQQMHSVSSVNVINQSTTTNSGGGMMGDNNSNNLNHPPTTRRSISFTGGVPISPHPFHQHQYTQLLPPTGPQQHQQLQPQVAHQSSTYHQMGQGQLMMTVVGGGTGGSCGGGISNQPIRLGRIDRFSRTCKLPTVQEVGKLHFAESSPS